MKKLSNRLLIFLLSASVSFSFPTASFAQARLLPDPGATIEQRFGRVPAAGVHPRVLIGPDELPAVRRLLQTTEVGKFVFGKVEEIGAILHTPGRELAATYDGLVKGNRSAISYARNVWWGNLVPLALAAESYGDLIRQDQVKGQQTAAALATLASIPRNWGANDTDLMYLAFAYDFDYPYMTAQQRNIVRQTIAANTAGKKPYAADFPPDWRNYNWIGRGANLTLAALAIEGEPGYDVTIYPASRDVMRDFVHYGISQTGGGVEEMHYFHYGMAIGAMAMAAFARHGDNLFSDPHYRALPNWLVASMEPFGDAFSMHQDTAADTGGLTGNYTILKWVWPNDPVVDMVWRNLVDGNNSGSLSYNLDWFPILVYPADPVGWHPYTGKAPRTKWGVTPWAIPAGYLDPVHGIEALKLPDSYWDPERGLLISRNQWGSEGMVLHVDFNVQANGSASHSHSNSSMFTFSALQRKWAIDRGFRIAETKDSSDVLIDGRGQGFPPVGGKTIEYQEAPGLTVVSGDASQPFDWISRGQAATGAPALAGFHWAPDLSPETVRRFAEIAKVDKAHPWVDKASASSYVYRASYNPVQKAFRTAAVRRSTAHSYALIVDDIRKDNAIHQYDWLMQLADDLVVKSTNGGSVVLGSLDANDKRRLLVQMIAVNGGGSWTLEKYEVKRTPETSDTTDFGPGFRLKYTVRTVEPGFKVLLYPFLEGEPLPQVSANSGEMEVRWPDQQDRYSLTSLPTGRTEIRMAAR